MSKLRLQKLNIQNLAWLHRIQALIDVNEKVPKGTLGGFERMKTICHRKELAGFMMMQSVAKR